MLEDIFWCVVIYLVYRFVFELVIPITKTVNRMKTTVNKMQEQQQQYNQNQYTKQPPTSQPNTTSINEEYIDFEEVKD
jgi:hypothetical protein